MTVLWYIIGGGVLMSLLSLSGVVTLAVRESTLDKVLTTLIAFSAGSLMGGAFFHLVPTALHELEGPRVTFAWLLAGFTLFFVLEQFMHWHHCHGRITDHKAPVTYLILVADALHNLLGGVAVGVAFLVDVRLGMTTWLAEAAHEVPQELGDFAVLVKGGWSRMRALAFNFLSSLTFLAGGLAVYAFSREVEIAYLLPFAAGNFLYIAASDLVPQVNKWHGLRNNLMQFTAFLLGLGLLFLVPHGSEGH